MQRSFAYLLLVVVLLSGCRPSLPLGQWSADSRQFAAYDVQIGTAYRMTRPDSDDANDAWSIERLNDATTRDPMRHDPAFLKAVYLRVSKGVQAGAGVDADLRRYAIAWYETTDEGMTLQILAAPFGTVPLPEPVGFDVPVSVRDPYAAIGRFWHHGRAWLQVQWSPDGKSIAVSAPALRGDERDEPPWFLHLYDVETQSLRSFPDTAIPAFRSGGVQYGAAAESAPGVAVLPGAPDCNAFRPDSAGFLAVRRDPETKRVTAAFIARDGESRDLQFAGFDDDEASRRLAERLTDEAAFDALSLPVSRYASEKEVSMAGAASRAARDHRISQMSRRLPEIRWNGNVAIVKRSSLTSEDSDVSLRIDTQTGKVVAGVVPPDEAETLERGTVWEYAFPATGVKLRSSKSPFGYERMELVRPDGTSEDLDKDEYLTDSMYWTPNGTLSRSGGRAVGGIFGGYERLGKDRRWTHTTVYPSPDGKWAAVFAGRRAESWGTQPPREDFAVTLALIVRDDGFVRPIDVKPASE